MDPSTPSESSSQQGEGKRRRLPKSVLYSTSAKIGGSGLDVDAFEAVRGLNKAGILGLAVAYGNRQQEVPAERIQNLRSHPVRLLGPIAHHGLKLDKNYYGAKKHYLDWVAAKQLRSGKFDLFHGWSGECVRTLRVAKKMGIPTVIGIPTWHRNKGKIKPLVTKSERQSAALRFPRNVFERMLVTRQQVLEEYELADLLLVFSEKAAETFLVAGVPRSKLFYVPTGVDAERFTPGTPPDIFRAVFVGALIKRKGVHTLLEAWHALKLENAELVLVGTAHREILPYLEKYRTDSVRLAGFSSSTADHLRNASVHIFPSKCEGCAKVTCEAAACGLPQITTRESGDVVIDGLNGLVVPPEDPQALAAAIKKLHGDPALRLRMGAAARSRCLEHFTWDRVRERTMEAYALASSKSH